MYELLRYFKIGDVLECLRNMYNVRIQCLECIDKLANRLYSHAEKVDMQAAIKKFNEQTD